MFNLISMDKSSNVLNLIIYDTETCQRKILCSLRYKRIDYCAVIMYDVIVVLGSQNQKEGLLTSVGTFTGWRELPGMKGKRDLATAVVKPHN